MELMQQSLLDIVIGLDISAEYNKLAEWRTEGKATPKFEAMLLFAALKEAA